MYHQKCHVFFKPYLIRSYHMLILSNVFLLFLLAFRPTSLFKNVVSLLLILCFSTQVYFDLYNNSSTNHEMAYYTTRGWTTFQCRNDLAYNSRSNLIIPLNIISRFDQARGREKLRRNSFSMYDIR